jgi:dihydroxyacetone kinase
MIALPFDTMDVRRRLIDAGFSDKQADEAVAIAREVAGDVLVTKADLRESLRELELRLTLRFGSMLAAAVVILGAFELVSR